TVDIETEDIAYALAIQADGKIVAAGYSFDGANADFALVRCDENGEPDQTFGTDGIVTVDIDTDDRAYALAIQDDGKIVAAGYSFDGANTDFALVRCDENGEPDQTFDTDGIVITQVASPVVLMRFDEARALAIQADGKIIAAGKSYNSTDDDFALVRYE
ncbi:MAG TPA: delta-60 repeat domain-containing protein, partial [Deltaproteobacteria bacterium]|nr:delta-60 repeat domain-containing protein [Deltaproteobacteria bacterium]HRR20064.1 delta-60 repeat domain-containing protein [Desulfomonilia bacterium]